MNSYPKNWKKASRTLRRIVGHCEVCGVELPACNLTVHHAGVDYADGRQGDPRDKYDLRRENLVTCCVTCHAQLDNTPSPYGSQAERKRIRKQARLERRRERFALHRSLNVGTGLVPYHHTQALICLEVAR